MIYDFAGDEAVKEAAMDAVTVSQEKYCGVSYMLKKALPVTWQGYLQREKIFNNKPESILSW